jgi:hypothetical protein
MNRFASAVVLFLLLAVSVHAAPATQPVELAEVTTTDDLQKQPAIDVPGVGKVRLGISSAEAGLGPCRVVFCLQESQDHREIERAHRREFRGEERDLGPLRVAWKWEKEVVAVEDITRMARVNPKLPATFQTSVPLRQAGKVTITVYTPAGQVLASRTFDVDEAAKKTWQQFATWPEEPADAETPARVEPHPEPVVPRVESLYTATRKGDLLDLARPSLKLTLKDNLFTIDAGEQIMMDQPAENLAARWWVNGQPRQEAHAVKCGAAMQAAAVRETKQMKVSFGLPSNLGDFRVGDKIAVQVMYSSGGFELASDGRVHAAQAMPAEGGPILAVSDKLEFVVTEAMVKDRAKP